MRRSVTQAWLAALMLAIAVLGVAPGARAQQLPAYESSAGMLAIGKDPSAPTPRSFMSTTR